jgi:hypothetical protein
VKNGAAAMRKLKIQFFCSRERKLKQVVVGAFMPAYSRGEEEEEEEAAEESAGGEE